MASLRHEAARAARLEALRPTHETDAYEDGVARHVPIIFLSGPIKHWWTCWGSPEHEAYLRHRGQVRSWLIEAGYLTYAPWDGIKGSWDLRAQAINEAAITIADLILELTPPGIPAEGTAEEARFAEAAGVSLVHVVPGIEKQDLLAFLVEFIGEGVSYEEE